MLRKFLFVVLFVGAIAPAVADTECPKGYGYRIVGEILSEKNLINPVNTYYGAIHTNRAHVINRTTITSPFTAPSLYAGVTFVAKVNPSTTYTYTNDVVGASGSSVCFYENEADITDPTKCIWTQDSRKFTTFPDTNYVVIAHWADAGATLTWNQVQLEEGDTATPYEPYILLPMPIIKSECTLCPPNTYKDTVGNSECTPCPDSLVSPSGAKNIDECGHVLHVGDSIAFMPVGKRTEHGLCTMLDGVKYCADLYEKE